MGSLKYLVLNATAQAPYTPVACYQQPIIMPRHMGDRKSFIVIADMGKPELVKAKTGRMKNATNG